MPLIDGTGAHIEVGRGDVVESRHRVSIAVMHASAGFVAGAGDPELVVYARSAIKPIQALPLVADRVAARYNLGGAELAVACASHSGEPVHVQTVAGFLERLGLTEDSLACGPQRPMGATAAEALREAGIEPGRLHNNCSGKHAGMLALALAHGWPTHGYHEPSHPVQRRMASELAQWSGVPERSFGVGVDGCGVATFALPLRSLATAFARLAAAARSGADGPATILEAMAAHPELVGGTGRLCTAVIRVTSGRVLVKVGAEGVYCVCVPARGLGIALKVEDGGRRALAPALLAVLEQLGLLSEAESTLLAAHARPVIRNTRGEEVGWLKAQIRLDLARAG
jgi:L-asparaginase II